MHTVAEVMTTRVVTVGPDAPVTVAARIMRDAGVSGLPVIDSAGRVVGILTEADLLHRAVVTDSPEERANRGSRDQGSGSTVADFMSRDFLGVRRDDPLAKAARLMEKARVRRLVVAGDGFTLEGIISRSDVVAALARSDAELCGEIRSRVVGEVMGLDPNEVDVTVNEGVVTLAGVVRERREADRLARLAGKVLGVSRVESALTWEADTTHRRRIPPFGYFATRHRPEGRPKEPRRATGEEYDSGEGISTSERAV